MNTHRLERAPSPILEEHGEISLGAVLEFLGETWPVLAGTIMLVVAATLTYVLLSPRSYTATAAFTPQTSSRQSALAGLASQFGLNVGGADATRSPSFYADLVVSRELLGAVVDSTFQYVGGRDTIRGPLVTLLKVKGATPAIRRERAIAKLRTRVASNVAQRTGVVSVSVASVAPALSYEILRQLLSQLDRFNRLTRQSEAVAEQSFTEQRLKEVRGELLDAENALQRFLQENRGFRTSSEASFQEQRLQRELGLRQALFTTLSQAYEQAKIEAVRDTPVITIIESPELPALPDPRGTFTKLAVAIVGGLAAGILLALLRYRKGLDRIAASDPAALR